MNRNRGTTVSVICLLFESNVQLVVMMSRVRVTHSWHVSHWITKENLQHLPISNSLPGVTVNKLTIYYLYSVYTNVEKNKRKSGVCNATGHEIIFKSLYEIYIFVNKEYSIMASGRQTLIHIWTDIHNKHPLLWR